MKKNVLLAVLPVFALMSLPVQAGIVGEETKLTASDQAKYDEFGISVAISGDIAIIGAFRNDDDGARSGSAYIFERDVNGVWSEVTKLIASDASQNDNFGYSVAINGDTAIIGAPFNYGAAANSGSAYIFERDVNGVWSEVTILIASDASRDDNFGYSVAISGDTAIVGAYRDNDGNVGDTGSAYLFERDAGGENNWGEVKKLTASDASENDQFGWSVAISEDRAVVGAPFDDDAGLDSGAIYIFGRNAGGVDNWGEITSRTASDASNGAGFGWSVAIDGNTVIVGAPIEADRGSYSGGAYIFEQDAGGVDNWGETRILIGSDVDEIDGFGRSVAISKDWVIVGAPFDSDYYTFSGAAYLFDRDAGGENNWGEVTKLTASDASRKDTFGYSVAISGHAIIVGEPIHADDSGNDGGSAYVFRYSCQSDFDNDGDVDGSDAASFSADFGRTDCQAVGNLCAGDMDQDGYVDESDMAIFSREFGRTDCPK